MDWSEYCKENKIGLSTALTDEQWRKVAKAMVNVADYDIAKQLDPELNEHGPMEAESFMQELVDAGKKALDD